MKASKFLGPLMSSKKSYELRSISKDVQAPEVKLDDADMPFQQPFLKCRYMVTFVGFWCFFINSLIRLNMSVSIVAMVNQSAVAQREKVKSDSCPLLMPNYTQAEEAEIESEDGEFLWSPEVQGYILSSFFLGYVISQIPAGRLVDVYGCKWFLVGGCVVTAVTSFLIPIFSWISADALIALQFIRGLAQGPIQPGGSVLVSNWFPRSEKGQMFAIMKSGFPIGSIVASLLSGFLCESSAKWPSSFYVTGAIGVVVSILLLVCLHERPRDHPRITKAELDFILKGQEEKLKKPPNVPWRKIFTSVPVYALFYSSFGHFFAQTQFFTLHMIFLGTILHYRIAKNAVFTSLTFLLQFVFIQVSTHLSSLMIKKKIASITFTRKFFNTIDCLGLSASMLGIYLSGCNSALSVIFAILATGFTGVGSAGSIVIVPEMAPTFSGILNGFNIAIASMAPVILPLIVGFLTDEQQTIEQWNKVFFVVIGVLMSSGIFFCVFGSADVQPWNFVQEEKKEEKTESKTRF